MKKSAKVLSPSKEDYLETILMLSSDGEPVRLVDIARAHDVSKATVSDTLSRLGDGGYVVYEKYRPVTLTQKGKRVAALTLDKHNLLIKFLTKALGVEYSKAEVAACKMEHAIGADIACRLSEFIGRLESNGMLGDSDGGPNDV